MSAKKRCTGVDLAKWGLNRIDPLDAHERCIVEEPREGFFYAPRLPKADCSADAKG